MKRLILLLTLTISITLTAQDREKRFSVFLYSDPVATEKDGFNFGLGVDYQMNIVYFKAQLFLFPNLRENTYREATGSVGFNLHTELARFYTGMKLGKISRASGHGGGTIGFEAGIDINLNDTWYIGIGGSHDLRTDGKAWGEDEHNYWRNSGYGKLGFRF